MHTKHSCRSYLLRQILLYTVVLMFPEISSSAGTVTLLTHGYNSNTKDWLTSMGNAINNYPRKVSQFGQTDSIYNIYFDQSGFPHSQRVSANSPSDLASTSGDIILLLDWNPYSGSLSRLVTTSTVDVAPSVATALLSPSFIPELNGAPLASLPIHLVGHSRGGSLICEISKKLGEHGVAVDQLTMLDPHPLNNDGFENSFLDNAAGPAVDGTVINGVYENVTYAEDVYETNDTIDTPEGTAAHGAYIRFAQPLQRIPQFVTYGYGNPHSDIHLWYHATITRSGPETGDGRATITQSGRIFWFKAFESSGLHAGYYYSLAGGGARNEQVGPANSDSGQPIDGLNHEWTSIFPVSPPSFNRRPLTIATSRANIVTVNLFGSNGRAPSLSLTNFSQGAPIYYFAVTPTFNALSANIGYWIPSGGANIRAFVDNDQNPLNGFSDGVPISTNIGASATRFGKTSIDLAALANLPVGRYYVGFIIEDSVGKRYMYAPEFVLVLPDLSFTWKVSGTAEVPLFDFAIKGISNSGYALQNSSDLSNWDTIAIGTLSPSPETFVGSAQWNSVRGNFTTTSFFRVVYR